MAAMAAGGAVYGDLSGARALVTGASGGIGAEIARALGRQGARVAVAYHTRPDGAREVAQRIRADAGGSKAAAVVLRADLRSASAAEALFDAAVERLGAVDIVVNNAGIVLKGHSEDCGVDHFDDITAVNLRAPYLLSRKLAAHKRARDADGGGVGEAACGCSVINNTSIHGTLSAEYMGLYAMTKVRGPRGAWLAESACLRGRYAMLIWPSVSRTAMPSRPLRERQTPCASGSSFVA